MEQQPPCGFEGNNDLYGLGLRIGLYIQYVALAFANLSGKDPRPRSKKDEEEEPERSGGDSSDNTDMQFHYLRSVVLVYVLSNFIAMLHATKNRHIHACEVVILLLELLPQLTPAARPRTKLLRFIRSYHDMSELPSTVLFLVIRAFIFYQTYFWWRGVDVLPPAPCGEGEVVWFFVRTRLRGWLMHFFRFLFLALSIGAVLDVAYFLWELFDCCCICKGPIRSISTWLCKRETKNISVASTVLIFIFSVAAIEMTIQWNGILSVYRVDSVGQLLPILVSVGTLAHMLCAALGLGN